MAKKTLEQKIDSLTSIVEKGFAASDKKFGALAEDVADIRETMATKDQVCQLALADVRRGSRAVWCLVRSHDSTAHILERRRGH